MMLFELGWQLLVILLLVCANGFFVAAEFAIVKIRASQLKPLLKTGDWRVPMALRAVNNLDACLSATQLGITLASLGLGWLGEPFLAHWLVPVFEWAGVSNERTQHSLSFAAAFLCITFLHIVLGELAPKSLAIQRPRGVSLWIAAPLLVFYYIFFPFIYVLNGTANMFLRWAGLGAGVRERTCFLRRRARSTSSAIPGTSTRAMRSSTRSWSAPCVFAMSQLSRSCLPEPRSWRFG